MKYAVALSALAAVTFVSAQDTCSQDFDGYFEYNPVPIADGLNTIPRSTCTAEPYSSLKGGVLTDQCKRTGEIVANYQFQYDLHLQNNALNTAGFCINSNNTLSIGGNAVFYHCLSGNFYNLYDESLGAQCSPVYLQVISCDLPSDAGSDCPPDTPSSALPVSSSSTTLSTSATPTSPSSAAAPAVTSAAAYATPAAPIVTVSLPYSYPSYNATTSATATGVATGTGSTGTPTTSPIAFHGGAASLALGGKLLVSAVGIAAFAFLA